jgi:hypothetical protein
VGDDDPARAPATFTGLRAQRAGLCQGETALLLQQALGGDQFDALRGRQRFDVVWIGGQQEFTETPRQLQLSLEQLYRRRVGFAKLGSHVPLSEYASQRRNRFGQIAIQVREPSAGPSVLSRRRSADGTHVAARKEPNEEAFFTSTWLEGKWETCKRVDFLGRVREKLAFLAALTARKQIASGLADSRAPSLLDVGS